MQSILIPSSSVVVVVAAAIDGTCAPICKLGCYLAQIHHRDAKVYPTAAIA
jgi:hypothetical protein